MMADRERNGREPSPSAAILDSQSVRTVDQKGGGKGYDASKKITGRKRHILTDTDGRLLAVRVHAGDVQDRDGGKLPLQVSRRRYPFVTRVFADGGYAGRLVTWASDKTHITIEIVLRGARAKGFEVLPRRWVVERTWIFKNRRLVRDYEQLTEVAETLIAIAASATPSVERSRTCCDATSHALGRAPRRAPHFGYPPITSSDSTNGIVDIAIMLEPTV